MEQCTTGIYLLTIKKTGAVYVGSTATSFKKRWYKHVYCLKKGIHDNPHLQNSWDKYGEFEFEFSILEYITDKKVLLHREQVWLDFYKAQPQECYNVAPVAGSMLGFKFNAASKQKMGDAFRGKKQTQEHIDKRFIGRRQTYSFTDPVGNHYTKIRDIKAFCKTHNLHEGSMRHVFTGVAPRHKKWTKYGAETAVKLYKLISPDGVVYQNVPNIAIFCKEHNLLASSIHKVAKGQISHYKGWVASMEERRYS